MWFIPATSDLNPLSPHDALKHHFITLKTDLFLLKLTVLEDMNIALRRFLHNHGNIATERSMKPGLCPTIISNDFKGSL